jgi:phosphopantothenoylcysteine decarboxylase
MRRILLGLTGSVATVLYEKLIKELQKLGPVDVILTEKAKHFIDFPRLCDALEANDGCLLTEEDEWTWRRDGKIYTKWQKDDDVLHIQLRDNHSAFVIAPCSANTLAKLANGMCDNLLTSVARAWDLNRPLIIAPAMNTHMWEHPITEEHLKKYSSFSNNNWVIHPQSKMLACKTNGKGALAEISTIVDVVYQSLKWTFPLTTGYCPGIPVGNHPGAFAVKRKNSTHTGVDLYVHKDAPITPVEDGRIVAIEHFTGPKDNSPWWLDTDCMLVEGASGVICYGEMAPCSWLKIGDKVTRSNTVLGYVLQVIPDKYDHPELVGRGWKKSMLHLELYPHKIYKPSDGYEKNKDILIDPTPYLINSIGCPSTLLK